MRWRRAALRWSRWACALLMVGALGGLWHGHRCRALPVGHLQNLELDGSRIYRVEGRVRDVPRCYVRAEATSWLVDVEVHVLIGQDDRRLDVTRAVQRDAASQRRPCEPGRA